MKILLLDVYPQSPYRISKDQNGAYGTANNYGTGFVSKLLQRLVKSSIDFPSLFTVQVCGELKYQGHDVKFSKELDLNENFDLYILPSSIVCHETEIEYIKLLTKYKKNVIAIGPFVSSNPQSYLDAGAKIIKGEPEMFFHNPINKVIDFEKLPSIIENFQNYSLDELYFPGWETIFENYIPKMKFLGNGPTININASRGCPYSCFHYCVYPLQQGRKLRVKSPKRVLEEMNYFNDKLGVSNFIFRDPVFTLDRNHTIAICEEIINSTKKFNICIEAHLKNIDEELTRTLNKAGVKLIYVGIESGDIGVRSDAKRWSEENSAQIEKVNYLEKNGIKVKCMYIIGLPSDTEATYKKTVKYAQTINSSYAQFSVFTPYPGTPVFTEYKDKIFVKNYEDYTQFQLIFKHENFTPEKIIELLNYSYRQYYTNPKWFIHFIIRKLIKFYGDLYYRLFRIHR